MAASLIVFVDVPEFGDVQAIIEEMRRGKAYELPKEGMARSKLAAGPTTLEDLVGQLSLQHKLVPADSLQPCMVLICR